MQIDNDDLLYEYVLEELEKVEPIKGLWAKAIAHSEGNNEKAKSLYMQYRVQAIKDEFKALKLDYNGLKKEEIFSIIKDGFEFNEETEKIKIQQEEKLDEEKKVVEKQQQELLKKADEEKYGKIGGWLIFFAVLIVLWNLSQLGFIEYFTDEYISTIQNIYLSGNEKMAKIFSYIFYSELFKAFILFLFTLSFFSKASITRVVAICLFIILFVVKPFQYIGLMNIYKEINEFPPIEVIKIIGSLLWAFVFLLYFIFSKRVKKTFTQQKDITTLVVASLIIPFLLWLAYSSKNGKPSDYSFNKDNSNTINSSIQSDNNPIENSKVAKNENVSNSINSKSDNINTNNTKEEPIINKWKYKDWEVENIDNNYIKAFTVGKNRADIFTIIKKKDDCNPSFLYTTTHLFDKSIIVNENDILKMDIKVDNELFNSDTPIYKIYNLGFVRQLMSKPYPLYESFLDKLKKGNTIQTTVYSPILKNIDITPKEEYSLNGFTKAFNILNEACRDISVLDKYKDIDKNISSK